MELTQDSQTQSLTPGQKRHGASLEDLDMAKKKHITRLENNINRWIGDKYCYAV